jgi:DNA-directed RNA polymerase subunit M/transcription elongation factor TFIIS
MYNIIIMICAPSKEVDLLDKLSIVCLKVQNRVKILPHLSKYNTNEAIHVIAQMAWDKSHGMGVGQIYTKLKNDKYLWNWYEIAQDEFAVPETQPGALTCGKCGSNRIKMRAQQTRSGDEGQTVFAMCSQCYNKWSTS